MKKLLVLSALLGLLALPVFADHVSFDVGGDDTLGFLTDFGDAVAEKIDLTFDMMVGIDDYNSLTWSVKTEEVATGGFYLANLDQVLVTTDIGMWAGLPLGFMVNWGLDDPDANEFGDVTGFENEQVYDLSPEDPYWGMDFLLSYNIVEVEVAVDPGDGNLLAGLAVKEPIPGLNAEVYYFQGQADPDVFDQGQIAVGASYETDVAGISLKPGVAFVSDMADAAANAWAFGVGVAASVDMFDFTVGIDGNETDTLNEITATAVASPIDMVSIYVGLETSFADGADNFQGADIGVNPHVGLVDIYLGYLITSNGAGQYNADFDATEAADGGAYIKFDVDY